MQNVSSQRNGWKKTATNSELQMNENDTQIHIKGREFSYTIDRRTALFTEMKFAGREYLNHSDGVEYLESSNR